MFSYSGWNAAAYVAEEIKDPGRNVPLALGLGVCPALAGPVPGEDGVGGEPLDVLGAPGLCLGLGGRCCLVLGHRHNSCVVTVWRRARAVQRAAALLGKVARPSTATDLLTLAVGMILGFLIGLGAFDYRRAG